MSVARAGRRPRQSALMMPLPPTWQAMTLAEPGGTGHGHAVLRRVQGRLPAARARAASASRAAAMNSARGEQAGPCRGPPAGRRQPPAHAAVLVSRRSLGFPGAGGVQLACARGQGRVAGGRQDGVAAARAARPSRPASAGLARAGAGRCCTTCTAGGAGRAERSAIAKAAAQPTSVQPSSTLIAATEPMSGTRRVAPDQHGQQVQRCACQGHVAQHEDDDDREQGMHLGLPLARGDPGHCRR